MFIYLRAFFFDFLNLDPTDAIGLITILELSFIFLLILFIVDELDVGHCAFIR